MPTADDYRSFELEAAAASSVARGRTALGSFLKFGVPIGALIVAGWMIYGTVARRAPALTTPDQEEFRTTQFPAPSLSTPRVQTNQGTIVIPQAPAEPAPPPPPVAPPLALPAPPPPEPPLAGALPNDDEARRLAELERQRQEEERRKWERLRLPRSLPTTPRPRRTSPARRRLPGGPAGRRMTPIAASFRPSPQPASRFPAPPRTIGSTRWWRQGTMIRGILETALQSDLPGMVRAVVTENVWSFDGRRVLIPAGSRLVGEYKSGIAQGQTRVFVVWTRMLRSDGVSVQLGSNGTDDLGRAGNAGFVDNHYMERFGSAILLSIVGGAAQFLSAYGQNTNNTSGNGSIITTTDPVTGVVMQTQTGVNQLNLQARQIAAQNVSQTLTNIAQEALRNSINIPPTIYLDQGTPDHRVRAARPRLFGALSGPGQGSLEGVEA